MKKQKTLSILGVILVLLPFMGIPYDWKQIVIFLFGLYIASVTWSVWKKPSDIINNSRIANEQ